MEDSDKYSFLEDYFTWLCGLVCDETESNYISLLSCLFKEEFYSILGNDDDRGADGKVLRSEFGNAAGYDEDDVEDYISGPCRMLEMLIGLARRMAFDTAENKHHDKSVKWFWELISNLGLDGLTDDKFFQLGGNDIVRKKIRKLLDRKYSKKGKGGLFPLKKTEIDQRKVEIWYQMSAYLAENCDI